MPDPKSVVPQSFLVHLYFVAATLIGLILIIISGVTLSRLVLNQVLGVQERPSFSAPYPPYRDPTMIGSTESGLTAEQQASLDQWQKQYEEYQQQEQQYNEADQTRRRQIAESLAMLIVGIPVFGLHAPYVFKRRN